MEAKESVEDESEDEPVASQVQNTGLVDNAQQLLLVLRLSASSSIEAKQWVSILQQGCALGTRRAATLVTDVVSAELPDVHASSPDSADLTQKKQQEQNRDRVVSLNEDDLSPVLLQRMRSSRLLLQQSGSRLSLPRAAAPIAIGLDLDAETGADLDISTKITENQSINTLSSDAGANSIAEPTESSGLRRRHGVSNKDDKGKTMVAESTSVAAGANSATDGTVTKVKVLSGSHPMHLKSQPSPLSNDMRHGEINYRGFFNLAAIILVLSNLRIVIDSHIKYGFLPAFTNLISASQRNTSTLAWVQSAPAVSLATWLMQALIQWALENFYVSKWCPLRERGILLINYLVGIANIVLPTLWVWRSDAHWGGCMVYLFQSTIMWMKLISYAHANRDLRMARELYLTRRNSSMEALNLQGSKISSTALNASASTGAAPPSPAGATGTMSRSRALYEAKVLQEVKDLKPPYLRYPQNLTLRNVLYFCVAPTLCYQLNYPRSERIRWKIVLTILFRMLIVSGLILFGSEQYIKPTLQASMQAMHNFEGGAVALALLKLSIPNTYIWLLIFYFYFHLWLNLLGELTRFGDRSFYRDWWNARTIERYWRDWNIPVHHWMLRHVYYPLLRAGVGRAGATFGVFFFSAVFHEVIISVPFKHISMHAFYGMLAQAPLTFLTRVLNDRFDNALIGNAFFWCVFCIVGQPCGILLIAYDHWRLKF